MPGYWNAHSDRDWEDECHMHDEPEPEPEPEPELDAATVKRQRDDLYGALNGLLSVIDRVLFNKPTRADYAKIEAAHKLVRGLGAPQRED